MERKPFYREVATGKAERPHPFEGPAAACAACGGDNLDERHTQWARTQTASRQSAAQGGLPREHG